MVKVFLDVPTQGRGLSDVLKSIDKMKVYATTSLSDVFEEDTEVKFYSVLDTDSTELGIKSPKIAYLGNILKLLADCDVLVTVDCPFWLIDKTTSTIDDVYTHLADKEVKKLRLPLECVMSESERNSLYSDYQKF